MQRTFNTPGLVGSNLYPMLLKIAIFTVKSLYIYIFFHMYYLNPVISEVRSATLIAISLNFGDK